MGPPERRRPHARAGRAGIDAARHPYFAGAPLVLAHRGGAGYDANLGIENTIRAFANAVALGCTHLETDVHVTRDHVLVAAHDTTLDRVTDGTGAITGLTFAEVARARIGGSEAIPTFEAVLDAFPTTRINVDLKGRGTPEALWALLARRAARGDHAAYQRICVGSFSPRRLWRFRRLARGRVATAAGPLGVFAWRLLPYAVSRVVHTPGLVFQVPVRFGVRAGRLRVGLTIVTPAFVDRAHALGKHVHVWTVDDPDEMRRLLDLGVDGIVTDRPDVLRRVMARRSPAQ